MISVSKVFLVGLAVVMFAGCTSDDAEEKVYSYSPVDGGPVTYGDQCRSTGSSCVCGIKDGPTVHQSLEPLRDWIKRLPSNRDPLTPAQCIAVAAFAKTYDWFGESCMDRSADSLEEWIRFCFEGDWVSTNSSSLQCQLPGYHDDGIYGSSSRHQELLGSKMDGCMWSEATRHRVLSPQVIEEAVRFVRDPY